MKGSTFVYKKALWQAERKRVDYSPMYTKVKHVLKLFS